MHPSSEGRAVAALKRFAQAQRPDRPASALILVVLLCIAILAYDSFDLKRDKFLCMSSPLYLFIPLIIIGFNIKVVIKRATSTSD